jgi:hypothetical protein
MTLVPRGDNEMARTLRQWDSRPDVEIWTPRNSASGQWEALVGTELIQERGMLRFVNLVSAAIARLDEAARKAEEASAGKEEQAEGQQAG